LAGAHSDIARQEALSAVDDVFKQGLIVSDHDKRIPISQFVILMYQNKSLSFRGIYGISPLSEDYIRIYGRLPKILPRDIPIDSYLKYSSSSRSFTVIPTKTITNTTDAIGIDPAKAKKYFGNASDK